MTPPLQHAAVFPAFCSHPSSTEVCCAPKPGPIASPVEDVVDLPTDISPEPQKLAVDAMQNGLEKIPLSGVFAIKQVQELGADGEERRGLRWQAGTARAGVTRFSGKWRQVSEK